MRASLPANPDPVKHVSDHWGDFLKRVMITGGLGMIGSALATCLEAEGFEVEIFDIADRRGCAAMDITNSGLVAKATEGCSGIVHLAAISRVAWGERNPVRCSKVNVEGTRNVLASAARARHPKPWVLVASSREVYGQAASLPVNELAPLRPMNAYAKSKVAAEDLVADYRRDGLRASVVRFSTVYGAIADHPDRVVPAFARQAAIGGELQIYGEHTTLDFTHLDDTIAALKIAIELLTSGESLLPTLQLVSGRGITLRKLAALAIGAAGQGIMSIQSPRPYDVTAFVGDTARAEEVLGWRATTPIEEGVSRLVEHFGALLQSGSLKPATTPPP
jgi:nucleoside-diphosphate-sugar epimerase